MLNMNISLCPACGCKESIFYPHPLYRRCHECASLYQSSGIEKIEDYYDGRVPDFSSQIGSYRTYLRIMRDYIKLESYNLVDIGSGDGTFLDIAKPFVQTVAALDVSPTAKAILAGKGYLIDEPLSTLSPKIVTAWQVIEHVHDPRMFIRDLHIEEPDWLVITSPAPDSPTAQRLHSTGHWRSLSPSHHLCLFSKQGLDKLAFNCNLTLIHFEYTWSACHGTMDNFRKNALQYIKWPIKRLIGRKDLFPVYYGKNSFIALLRKADCHKFDSQQTSQ
jgi:hypothetical protein